MRRRHLTQATVRAIQLVWIAGVVVGVGLLLAGNTTEGASGLLSLAIFSVIGLGAMEREQRRRLLRRRP